MGHPHAQADSPRGRRGDRPRFAELAKFGAIGAFAFAVDLGVFNLLRFWWDGSPIDHKPITCRVVSVTLATSISYIGNRWWTWRHLASSSVGREYITFFAVNAVALLLGAAFLGFSNYVLDLHSALADNTANILSVVAGTAFRFWAYRRFVFAGNRS
ncbi:MAG: GtrA family protein [Actinomycetales bacterium]|nr:GtrA family protein [Actinomycetales bacterium]